jgi:predicted HD phosphohydrolase
MDRAIEEVVDEIVAACESMVGLPYDGEPVDQLQHALQCAQLAREAGGERDLVIAALLHDIARAPAVSGVRYDGDREHHGETAARWLEPRLGTRIAWLAEQHVPAKRYLVATDAAYAQQLTAVSRRTLVAQGGPMSIAEIEAFEDQPDWQLAAALRRFDDLGKDPAATVAGLDAYTDDLRAAVLQRVGNGTH